MTKNLSNLSTLTQTGLHDLNRFIKEQAFFTIDFHIHQPFSHKIIVRTNHQQPPAIKQYHDLRAEIKSFFGAGERTIFRIDWQFYKLKKALGLEVKKTHRQYFR